VALLAVVPAFGQQWHKISGVVVDLEGKPIQGARIDHGGGSDYGASTPPDGRFTLRTTAPAVVVRKPGYYGYRLLTSGDATVRVVLQRANSGPNCKPAQIPKVVITEARDIDYIVRYETVDTPDGTASIMIGNGPFWSYGIPNDDDVWNSVTYSEVARSDPNSPVWRVDARGSTAWGTYWRFSGILGQSKSYRGVSKQAAEILDLVFDHADCPKP